MKLHKEKHKASKEERKAAEARLCSENMRRLLTGFRGRVEDELRADGLTLPQLRLLKAVKQQEDVSAASLARTCHVTPQTMQAVLGRAVQAQWIVRGKSKNNDRFVTTTLTALGESVLKQGMDVVVRIEERIWREVGLSDVKQLNETLQAGIAALEGE